MTKRESLAKKQKIQDQITEQIKQGIVKEGDIFLNKAELFSKLGIKLKKGSQNAAYDKILQTTLKYELTGKTGKYKNEIIITEIYDKPQEIKDGREEKSGNQIYSKLIETILMIYMSENDQNVYYFTYPKIYQMLGMCNEYYHDYTLRKELKKEDHRFTDYEVNTFFSESSSLMKKTLIRALNSMKARSLIDYTKEIQIIIKDGENIKQMFTASDDDVQKILDAQREVLDDLGIDELYTAFMSMGYMKFTKKVNSLLKQRYGWDGYYEQLKIVTASKFFLDGAIEYDFTKLKNELNINIGMLINNTNQTLVDREDHSLEKDWKDYQDGVKELKGLYADYETYKEMNQNRSDIFLQLQSILVKLFISLAPEEEKLILKQITEKLSKDRDLQISKVTNLSIEDGSRGDQSL